MFIFITWIFVDFCVIMILRLLNQLEWKGPSGHKHGELCAEDGGGMW